jgi:hypothetical protein
MGYLGAVMNERKRKINLVWKRAAPLLSRPTAEAGLARLHIAPAPTRGHQLPRTRSVRGPGGAPAGPAAAASRLHPTPSCLLLVPLLILPPLLTHSATVSLPLLLAAVEHHRCSTRDKSLMALAPPRPPPSRAHALARNLTRVRPNWAFSSPPLAQWPTCPATVVGAPPLLLFLLLRRLRVRVHLVELVRASLAATVACSDRPPCTSAAVLPCMLASSVPSSSCRVLGTTDFASSWRVRWWWPRCQGAHCLWDPSSCPPCVGDRWARGPHCQPPWCRARESRGVHLVFWLTVFKGDLGDEFLEMLLNVWKFINGSN